MLSPFNLGHAQTRDAQALKEEVSRQRARLEAREAQLAAAEKHLDDAKREVANKQDGLAADLAVSLTFAVGRAHHQRVAIAEIWHGIEYLLVGPASRDTLGSNHGWLIHVLSWQLLRHGL